MRGLKGGLELEFPVFPCYSLFRWEARTHKWVGFSGVFFGEGKCFFENFYRGRATSLTMQLWKLGSVNGYAITLSSTTLPKIVATGDGAMIYPMVIAATS